MKASKDPAQWQENDEKSKPCCCGSVGKNCRRTKNFPVSLEFFRVAISRCPNSVSGIEVAHFGKGNVGPTIFLACEVKVWLTKLPQKRRWQKQAPEKK
jgi:hypothetical protein